MSMSQEEIEALMNESADLAPAIEEAPAEEVVDDTPMSQDDIASLLADSDINESTPEAQPDEDIPNMDDILAGIEGITDDEVQDAEEVVDANVPNMDDILAGIDGITDDEPVVNNEVVNEPSQNIETIMNEQIDQGVYPLPVEKEHKVVNQLNEVAEDSEEKASQIFDVLSFILDENNEIQDNVNAMNDFIEKQTLLLEALSAKFPNVDVISENLKLAQEVASKSPVISNK